MKPFREELRMLINKHSLEIGSHTPDFILADYLVACLDLFDLTSNAREARYGRRPDGEKRPGEAEKPEPETSKDGQSRRRTRAT